MTAYPAPPARRLAYDLLGARIFHWTGGGGDITEAALSAVQRFNSEADGGNDASTLRVRGGGFPFGYNVGILFPEQITISHLFCCYYSNNSPVAPNTFMYSLDTISFLDGTWAAMAGITPDGTSSTRPTYRTNIDDITDVTVKAIKFATDTTWGEQSHRIHIYGSRSANRLRCWQPATDAEVSASYFDEGDDPRDSVADKTFRIKNDTAQTAHDIVVSTGILTDATPSVPPQFKVSDGGAFGSTVTISSLAPGAISGVLTLRRETLANAALGPWAPRLNAVATSWT